MSPLRRTSVKKRKEITQFSHLLDIELMGKGYLTNFVFCVLGAVVVLWIWKKIFD